MKRIDARRRWALGMALTAVLVLAAAQVPRTTTSPLLRQLGVEVDEHGFPRENQVRLFRPTESMVDRVFVAGAAVGPKIVQQSVEQGRAAAMKALPVLILGGLTSVPGAIIGGLIIGVGEKVAEVFWGPAIGGAIENWFAYALALAFLLFRPQGLFGERIIERV